jgi:hypothetical protein
MAAIFEYHNGFDCSLLTKIFAMIKVGTAIIKKYFRNKDVSRSGFLLAKYILMHSSIISKTSIAIITIV